MNTIGFRIRKRRLALGLSQDQLAKKMGYRSRSTIAKIEAGENDISQTKMQIFAEMLQCSTSYLMNGENAGNSGNSVKIPVLGKVSADDPTQANETILDYEEISGEMAQSGSCFGLRIKGDSMEPRICEGDVVIVRRQPDVESGEIAIVLINGNDAVCKKVIKHDTGISLISFHSAYEPVFYTNEEISSLPVTIVGRMVELRGKF